MTATQTICVLALLVGVMGLVLIGMDRILDSEKKRRKQLEEELKNERSKHGDGKESH